jgi:DNA-binding transcriptional MerR regulator
MADAQLIEQIREMLDSGMSTKDIADALAEQNAEQQEAEQFERDAYGIDDRSQDDWTHAQVQYHDRLSYGRNEAGEWLGFM